MNKETILEMKGISKFFFNVRALNHVDFELRKGEVHCIVGENGSGKSTLIKVLMGAHQPNEGEIYFEGKKVPKMTPGYSQEIGIQTIFQEPVVQPELTVAENIFLGKEVTKGNKFRVIDWKKMFERARTIVDELGIEIDVEEKVKDLSSADTQTVQILKAISKEAKVIVMDEPTASYGRNEISKLHAIVEKLKARGISIIYISHHLEEVFLIADRITVIRDGDKIAVHEKGEADEKLLIKEMVGRDVDMFFSRERCEIGDVVFKADHISGNGVKNVSFEVRRGEILGLGGLVGAKRTELMRLVFGVDKMKSGRITFNGETYTPRTPKDSITRGICMITEDRQVSGLNLSGKIRENIVITNLKGLKGWPFIDGKEEKKKVRQIAQQATIKCDSIEDPVTVLSGGNQQKVVLSKWLFTSSMLYIFDEPTRGIDVGAKEEIYKIMVQLVREGGAIIMVSSDMLELLAMSDRILILHDGEATGELTGEEISEERVLSLAIGGGKN